MLTKNLLRTRSRGDKIYPQFIKLDNQDALALATVMCDVFSNCVGLSTVEIEEQLSDSADLSSVYYAGFMKLLFDRCKYEGDSEGIENFRWDILTKAKELRLKQHCLRLDDFQNLLEKETGLEKEEIFDKLFSDLPEFKKAVSFKPMDGVSLIHRYNCALIQGLLIHSNEIKVIVKKADTKAKRQLFRWIKFHQLLVEVEESEGQDEIVLFLSGPMSVFQKSQTYGLKLANFFPRLLNLEKWEIHADISFKEKNLSLLLDQGVKIRSHYKNQETYIPTEFEVFIKNFNENSKEWVAEVGNDFFHIGRQSYCFPDIVFTKKNGEKVHLELFHRWHFRQMGHRLESVEKNINSSLIFGVCRSSAKKPEMDKIINDSSWFSRNGFLFSDFPTHTAVAKVLKRF